MKVKGYEISLIIFGVYLVSSFVPILQIMMGYLNGAILWVPEQITGIRAHKIATGFNILMSMFFLFLYLKSKRLSVKILNAVIASFFISCSVLFAFEEYFIDTEIYWIQFVFGAIIIGSLLLLTDWIRTKNTSQ